MRTGRKPIRSPMTPPSGETSAPTRAAVPDDQRDRRGEAGPEAGDRPRRGPGCTAGSSGWPRTRSRRSGRSGGSPCRSGRRAARRRRGRRSGPVGTTSGRTSREPNADEQRGPDRQHAPRARRPPESDQPNPSMRMPASSRPDREADRPRRRRRARSSCPGGARGVTSRIPASMTPVLPSWNPMSSIARASCHGSRARARRTANTTASTRALRTMTTLRLYLSAHAPQSGTSGMPTTKISALKMPDEGEPLGSSGTPIWRR